MPYNSFNKARCLYNECVGSLPDQCMHGPGNLSKICFGKTEYCRYYQPQIKDHLSVNKAYDAGMLGSSAYLGELFKSVLVSETKEIIKSVKPRRKIHFIAYIKEMVGASYEDWFSINSYIYPDVQHKMDKQIYIKWKAWVDFNYSGGVKISNRVAD